MKRHFALGAFLFFCLALPAQGLYARIAAVMKRYIQQFLLFLFALLQCVAPLAHAHIGGSGIGHAIHAHEADVHPLSLAGYTHVERHEGAVISMPQACTISDTPSPSQPPATQAPNYFTPATGAVSPGLPEPPGSDIAGSGYSSPWPQAPPHIVFFA